MKVALVWNGDKSSAFAYGKVKGKFDVSFLITFLQKDRSNTSYLSTIKRQSENRGVPFFWAKMKTAHPEEYRETITELKEDYGIEGIVTNGNQSLIEDACKAAGIKVIKG
jgi:5,10-methylene-tetrahydrofolate dehydrogenase/methenyl tetrahydrofolate cyclohydrolase